MASCQACSAKSSSEHNPVRTVLTVAAVLTGAVVMARKFGPHKPGIDWEKRFERMPDNAPPKWMFSNIKAIRQNTDRILELLEHDRSDETGSEPRQT
jgi:hypothetical protein